MAGSWAIEVEADARGVKAAGIMHAWEPGWRRLVAQYAGTMIYLLADRKAAK